MTQTEDIAPTPEPPATGFPAADTPPITTSRPKSLIGNGLWSVAFTVWSTGVTFFLTPFLIARIGTDHYGLFILLMSISGMMGIMNLGLGEATLRYVAYYYGRNDLAGINRVVGATFSVYVVMGLLGWAALFFGAGPITSLLALSPADQALGTSLLRLTAFTFGLSFVSGAYASIPQALQRFDINTKVRIAQSIFQVAGTVTILFSGLGIYELVLWSVATAVFMQVVNTIVAKRLIPGLHLRPRPSKAGLKEVFGYGVFAFGTHILALLWSQVDRLLLGALVGLSAVTYLVVPQQLLYRLKNSMAGMGGGLMPRFSTDQSTARVRVFLDSTWLLLATTCIVFVPLAVFAHELLAIWVGEEFANKASLLTTLIAASCIVQGAFASYNALFRGIGKPQYIMAILGVMSGISVVTNCILIPAYGLAGAGFSSFAPVACGLVALAVAWRRVLRQPGWLPLLVALAPIVAAAAVCPVALLLRSTASSSPAATLFSTAAVAIVIAVCICLLDVALMRGNSRVRRIGLLLFQVAKRRPV